MLQRKLFVFNTVKNALPTRCIKSFNSGFKTSIKYRETGLKTDVVDNVGNIGHSSIHNGAIRLFLDVSESLMGSSKDHDFRQTITECRQRISQSGIRLDGHVLESVINMAATGKQDALIPHILQSGWWLNLNVPPTTYENICSSLVESRKWYALDAVLRFCARHDVAPTTKILNMRLRAYLHSENYTMLQVPLVKQMFSKKRCLFDRETYNILIEASVANRDMGSCQKIIMEMEKDGFSIDEATHRAILARMIAIGPRHALESTIFASVQGANPALDTAILNSLIRLRSIARDDATIKQYLSHIRSNHPQDATFTKDPPHPYWNVPPDISTISVLIEHFARRKARLGAQKAFDLIAHLGLKPSTEVVAQMILMYAKCGKMQKALSLTASLSKRLPAERCERSSELLQKLGWNGSETVHDISEVAANTYIFNALLKGIISQHGLNGVITILDLMDVHYVAPDDDTAALCLSFLNTHKKANSDDIISILYRFAQYPVIWRQRHINVILHSILREHKHLTFREGGWKGASTFSGPNRERKQSSDHSPCTYERANNVFSIVEGTKRPEEAFNRPLQNIFSAVQSSGARHDHATYSIRMLYHARITQDVEAVESLYHSMLDNDLIPNAYHVAALMEVYCVTGKVERAEEILKKAVLDGVGFNRVLYTLLIRAFGNQHDPESAHRVYQDMIRKVIQPDIAALEAVVRSYFLVQDYDAARTVLFQLWGTVLPLDTLPPPTTSLGSAMSHLRSLEMTQKIKHSKYSQTDAAKMKEILTKWRRSSKTKRTTKPALRRLSALTSEN